MKIASFALAAIVLGASLSQASAEPIVPGSAVVPAEQAIHATAASSAVVVEGRQAAPVGVGYAEAWVIARNAVHH